MITLLYSNQQGTVIRKNIINKLTSYLKHYFWALLMDKQNNGLQVFFIKELILFFKISLCVCYNFQNNYKKNYLNNYNKIKI